MKATTTAIRSIESRVFSRRQIVAALGGGLLAVATTGCAKSTGPFDSDDGRVIDFEVEQVAASFLEFAQTLIDGNESDAEAVVSAYAEWIERTPVDNVADELDDAVLIQWGASTFLWVEQALDVRGARDGDLLYRETSERFIEVTRQVNPLGGSFDRDAVGMFLQLTFGESPKGEPPYGSIFLPGSAGLANAIPSLHDEPDLSTLLRTPIVRIQAIVSGIG